MPVEDFLFLLICKFSGPGVQQALHNFILTFKDNKFYLLVIVPQSLKPKSAQCVYFPARSVVVQSLFGFHFQGFWPLRNTEKGFHSTGS